jgi:hypothetical protein
VPKIQNAREAEKIPVKLPVMKKWVKIFHRPSDATI